MNEIEARSLEEVKVHLIGVYSRIDTLEKAVRLEERYTDTFIATPWWKKLIFQLDGWSGHQIQSRPQWRPWRRWWTS